MNLHPLLWDTEWVLWTILVQEPLLNTNSTSEELSGILQRGIWYLSRYLTASACLVKNSTETVPMPGWPFPCDSSNSFLFFILHSCYLVLLHSFNLLLVSWLLFKNCFVETLTMKRRKAGVWNDFLYIDIVIWQDIVQTNFSPQAIDWRKYHLN